MRVMMAMATLVLGSFVSAEANVSHTVIFSDPALFAGWPANEGFWQWGDEMLVGFNVTQYEETADGHNVVPGAYQWINFARSLDGGETWTIEPHPQISTPGTFNASGDYVRASGYPAIPAPVASPGGFDFTADGFALKARGNRFWVTDDRGQTWSNPYTLPAFDQAFLTARTNYLVLDSQSMLLFYEATNTPPSTGNHWRTMVVQTTDGGQTFERIAWLTPDPLDGHDTGAMPAYALMPSVARLDDGTMLAAVRNRLEGHKWNDLMASTDSGQTWQKVATPIDHNDNPAALVSLGGDRLALVYGYRNGPFGIRGKISEDGGQTWSQDYILRNDGREWDLGYVRAGVRSDGNITAVYYYTTAAQPAQFIAGTIWDVPETAGAALAARYRFDEDAGPVLRDSLGAAHGDAHSVSFITSGVAGDRGNAGRFNGTSSRVDFADRPAAFDLGTDDFTIAGWVKAPTNTEAGVFGNRPIAQSIDYSGGGWAFELGRADRGYAGKIFFTVGGGDSAVFAQTQVFSDARLDDDQWHWIAVTQTGGVLHMFIDGVLQDDTGAMQSLSTATAPASVLAQFGMRGDSQKPFEGQLDDWMFFTTALTAAIDEDGNLIGGGLHDAWRASNLPEPAGLTMLIIAAAALRGRVGRSFIIRQEHS